MEQKTPVDVMYDQLLERVAWDDMQRDGKFITYFGNIDEFKEGLGLEVGNPDHDKAFKDMVTGYGFDIKDMQEDFIVIVSQDGFSNTLWNKNNTIDEIMDFLKREPSYKEYVHETKERNLLKKADDFEMEM